MAVEQILEDIFKTLDSAPVDGTCPFLNIEDKEVYESNIMFIYRRLSAAEYHYNNVKMLLEGEVDRTKLFYENIALPENIKHSFAGKISKLDTKYSNEFIAFLSAIRSGIDFMSKMMIRHINGVYGDSVTTLLRVVKTSRCKLIDIIKENEEWLYFIREYRDRLIHNYNTVYLVGSEFISKNGQMKRAFYPPVVSDILPEFELDTRIFREENSAESKFIRMEGKTSIEIDGKIVQESIILEIKPIDGFIPLDVFMAKHINKYKAIFENMMLIILEIGMRKIELEKI